MKPMLFGIIAQAVIFILSVILNNREIIKEGNIFLFMSTLLLAYGSANGGNGWEYVGYNEDEKNKVRDYRGKVGLKYLLFIIPSFIVMAIYFLLVYFKP